MPNVTISPDAIEEAAAAIDPVFRDSPQYVSEGLSEALGCRVLCKVESVNPIGSFKGRGADWWMRRRQDLAQVVCASAGNFGQAIAYAGRARGIGVQVFAAENANQQKLAAIRRLGARVHLHGEDLDAAKAEAKAAARADGLFFVEDGREPEITEGAGTIAVELGRYDEPIDVIYVPVGNGALAGGICAWVGARMPGTRVIGVSAAGAPAMRESWRTGKAVETRLVSTVADGIAIRVPIAESLPPLAGLHDFVLVSDDQMIAAMRALFEHERLVAEPAGAASLAAAMAGARANRGRCVATLLCGSNIDPARRAQWLG